MPACSALRWRRCARCRPHLVAFDTAIADLTPHLHDPIDVLFGIQLGGRHRHQPGDGRTASH